MSRLITRAAAAWPPTLPHRQRRTGAIIPLLLGLLLAGLPGGAHAAEKVVLQLHRVPQFEFAGYYAALWQGFYRRAGLDVEIRPGAAPGAPPIDAVREVTEGRAQFGTGGSDILIRAAQGLPLLLVAPIFQQSDAAVYYRADAAYGSPNALAGGILGRLPESNILDLQLTTALHAEGLNPANIQSVSIQPARIAADLAERKVDAAIGSAWDTPWQAHERGLALKSFDPGNYRVEFYGDSLFALQRMEKQDPATVQAFRDATIEGWAYALQHPDQVAARIVSELPSVGIADPAGFAHYQADVAKRLSRYPSVPLGHSNPDRWARIQQSLIGVGGITGGVDIASFVYDPDAVAQAGEDERTSIMIAAASATAALLLLLLLWRYRRTRRAAAPSQATIAPEDAIPPAPEAANPAAPEPEILARLVADLDKSATEIAEPLDGIRRQSLATPRLARLCDNALAGLAGLREIIAELGGAEQGSNAHIAADLNPVLGEIERSIRARLPRSVAYRASLFAELWPCHAAPETVAAIVLELVSSAAEDMSGGGDLIVGTRNYPVDAELAAELGGATPGDYVRVTVRDNGPGLPDDVLDQVFDPAHTLKPAIADAWQLSRNLDGFARAESAEGVGTAVHLYFRREEPTVDNAPVYPLEPPAKAAE